MREEKQKKFITKKGMIAMEEDLRVLKEVARVEVIKEVARAREFGDLSENAEYHSAREKQNLIDSNLQYLARQQLCPDL